MTQLTPLPGDGDSLRREEAQPQLALGQWYWVKGVAAYTDADRGWVKGKPYRWLGCVMHIGSNYVEIREPSSDASQAYRRVHFDDFWTDLEYEPNAPQVIAGRVAHFRAQSARLMGEVQALTARLGVQPTGVLAAPAAGDSPGTALATLSAQADVKAYEVALITARDKTLPGLFEAIKNTNRELTRWMLAETLPAKALLAPLEGSIGEIKDRIFNVSLYAGLVETVVCCREGAPAAAADKLHVMQRRLYMDEECLLDYHAGGMDIRKIGEFDAWLAKPENLERLLPFPRTLVAMRVRRHTKEREAPESLFRAFVNLQLEDADKQTFLYIRNGEQLWRLSTDIEFGELIFPDKAMYDAGEPKMVKMFCHRVEAMISRNEYDVLCAEYEAREIQSAAWRKANPTANWMENPQRRGLAGDYRIGRFSFRPEDWEPFDQSSVYFDECMAEIEQRIKEYNRVALIIQGLFDRSPVLHPHPPVQTWRPEGFARAIELVLDGSGLLPDGLLPPDFDAYRARCNACLAAGSVVTGQEDYWLRKEAEKENHRVANDWRSRSRARHREHVRFQPCGNDGPGRVAKLAAWKARSQEGVFAWNRERQTDSGRYAGPRRGDPIRTTLTVPVSELFNISAYTPGDYKQFFRDVRTRAQYLKWAPLLLAAEDFWAGKLAAQEPIKE